MIEQDLLRRFLFEELGVRGEWVKLTTSWQAAKLHQRGSESVQQQLGQALAAVVMLSATVKFKGSMILQAQGDGDIKTLVAQATDQRKIRGLVRGKENINAWPIRSHVRPWAIGVNHRIRKRPSLSGHRSTSRQQFGRRLANLF